MTDTALSLPVKEVEQTSRQMLALQKEADNLVITSQKDAEGAAALLEIIKSAERSVLTRKEEITRPLMTGLSAVRDLFRPIETTLDGAKRLIKSKMIAYQTVQEEAAEKKKAALTARLEKGTVSVATAIEKMGAIVEPVLPKGVQGRMITKVRVTDETLVPREYLIVDMKKVTEAVLRAGLTVPGVEKYKEKIIAV